MHRKQSINSVFPYLDEEIELGPISGSREVFYDKRVKISNWHDQYLVEPRDNKEFFPPKGNLRIASYNRFGTDSPETYLTETRDKFRKYDPRDFENCSQPVKMLNIFSFPLTDMHEKTELAIQRKRSPEKNIPEIISGESPPYTVHKRTLGYSLEDLEKLGGMKTFLDDDLEILQKISYSKMKRYNR